jgi:hypothetical protein
LFTLTAGPCLFQRYFQQWPEPPPVVEELSIVPAHLRAAVRSEPAGGTDG